MDTAKSGRDGWNFIERISEYRGRQVRTNNRSILRLKFIYRLDIEEYSKEIGIDIPKMVGKN